MIYYSILLLLSFIIYALISHQFVILLFFVTLAAWFFGTKSRRGCCRRLYAISGTVVLAAVLIVFKFLDFFVDSFCRYFKLNEVIIRVALPIGISFYIFRAISYVIDSYRNPDEQIYDNNYFEVALYIAFFPHLIAGPIARAKDFLIQIRDGNKPEWSLFESGSQQILYGVFKKTVIADHINLIVSAVFNDPSQYSSFSVLCAIIGYSLQIYYDFSGYSDIAIGLSRCLGFETKKNFDFPYISRNPREFWKKWHISLSGWLMDYIYIPLGGSRKGEIRTYINLMLTMLICGLWHGGEWSFIIWGAIHGAALVCYRAIGKTIHSEENKMYVVWSTVLNFIFVSMVWVFFRADNCDGAIAVFRALGNGFTGINWLSPWVLLGLIFVVMEYCVWKKWKAARSGEAFLDLSTVKGLSLFFIGIGITFMFAYFGNNPFIYAEF